jgi:hypothetical protein
MYHLYHLYQGPWHKGFWRDGWDGWDGLKHGAVPKKLVWHACLPFLPVARCAWLPRNVTPAASRQSLSVDDVEGDPANTAGENLAVGRRL